MPSRKKAREGGEAEREKSAKSCGKRNWDLLICVFFVNFAR